MTIPTHYRKMYLSFMRLACWMVFFGLLTGILFQESTRKVPLGQFPPGIHWEAVYHLALTHGHVFLIGVLIPLAVLALLHFSLILGANPISERMAKWGGSLYHAGAGMTVLLMLYKGYHYVLSVRGGQLDFAVIHETYFAGSHLLRGILYGLSHSALGAGLIILVIAILRNLPKEVPTIETVEKSE